jgi:DinB superfamily
MIADLFELDHRYADLLRNYSREQLNWRSAEGAWSMAQCIEHVARVNRVYIPPIKHAIAHGRSLPVSEDQPLRTAGWFSAFFLKSVSPEGKAKLRSPRIARPSKEPSLIEPEDSLRKLQATHLEIREVLESSNQPDLNRLRFKNPFVPLIRFTVGTGILIMVGHGRRHLLQAERICHMENFPAQSAGARTT